MTRSNECQIGDVIVLCDAGGLITDVASYEITRSEPLRLAELTVCTGKTGILIIPS